MVSQEEDNQNVIKELDTKIIQQIEYYFSDINLSKDKFMKELLTKDEGWVSLDTLLTFKRLKSLSEDKTLIINALKKSDSNLLEISETENKIRRRLDKPLPNYDEKYTQEFNERTVHLKGFPVDTKLDDVMNFCRKFGSVENIEMRRHFKSKAFKGCIFVTFVNKEDAQKVIDSTELKYSDKDLLRENKVNYFLRKKEFNDRKNSRRNSKNDKPVKKDIKSEETAEEGGDQQSETKQEERDDEEMTDQSKSVVKFEGAVLKLKGLDDKTRFSDIKKFFQQYGRVAYVEDVKQNESFVRFDAKDGAKEALEKAKNESVVKTEESQDSEVVKTEESQDSEVVKTEESQDSKVVKTEENQDSDAIKVKISDKEVIAELLTGDEELQYWTNNEKTRAENNKKRAQKKKEFYGKGRKGKNMWQRGRKRGYQGSGDRNGKRSKAEDSD